jgi:hypothetical protein
MSLVHEPSESQSREAVILAKAADLLEVGWVRGAYFRRIRGRPCYCVRGAISQAANGRYTDGDLHAERILAQSLGNPAVTRFEAAAFLEYWNDTTKLTQPGVVAACRRAAALAAGQSLDGQPSDGSSLLPDPQHQTSGE